MAAKFLRIKYIGLSNLLAQKMVLPEIVQHDLTPDNLANAMDRFIQDTHYYQSIEQELRNVKNLLTSGAEDHTLAELALEVTNS